MSEPGNVPIRLSLDEAVLLSVSLRVLDQLVEAIEINGVHQDRLLEQLQAKFDQVMPPDLRDMIDRIVEDIILSSLQGEGPASDLDAMTVDSSYALPMYATDDILPVIEQAIRESRTLEVSYYSMSREEFTIRRIDPYGLKRQGDLHWLVAYCQFREDRRVFRVDRIRAAALTSDVYRMPDDFQLGEYFDDE
jgi:predicted DNA-binding transcriptional regulator YafY